jgi:hypothetical protein
MSEANMYVLDPVTREFIPWDGTVAGGGATGGATEETLVEVRDRLPLGTARTPNFTSTTGSGTVTAGAQSVAVANIGGAAGTLKSQSFPANAVVSWSVINPLDTLGAIAYDATGTTFLITEVR